MGGVRQCWIIFSKLVLFFLNVRFAGIFFSKIALIVRIFKKNVRIFSKKNVRIIRFFPENCTDCTDFFSQIVRIVWVFFRKLYGFFLKMYGFFQKSFGHPEIVWIFILEIRRFCIIFHLFQQIFQENFRKNSRQNEVSLTYFLDSK